MKRIHKIFLMIGLSFALFVGSGQRTSVGAAGWPTIDVSNLLQNILNFLQSADVSGAMEEINSFGIQYEKYKRQADEFMKYLQLMQKIQKASIYVVEIAKIGVYMTNESLYLMECVDWFTRQPTGSVAVTMAANKIYQEFKSYADFASSEFQSKNDFVNSLKGGDTMEILRTMDAMLKDYQSEFYTLSTNCRTDISKLYYKMKRTEMALDNIKFSSQLLF